MAHQIGGKIREIRRSRQLTVSELAIRSGIAKSYVSYIERSPHANPSVDVLARICDALEIDIDVLLESKHNESSEDEWLRLVRDAQSSGITTEQFLKFIQEHLKR